jgi:glucose/arabinose dehydrogenase
VNTETEAGKGGLTFPGFTEKGLFTLPIRGRGLEMVFCNGAGFPNWVFSQRLRDQNRNSEVMALEIQFLKIIVFGSPKRESNLARA